MKRLLFILITVFCVGSQLRALPYDQARQEAWFLTDKMAYELNLTSDQYDRAYQVNLDYFLSIGSEADCYGYYWTYRDNDLRYILFDWQYSLYSTLDYFFRPVRWLRSAWYFPIFDHYRRGYYYFDRPLAYLSYRGVGWRRRGHNDRSPFAGYNPRPGGGLRDRYHAGGVPPTRPEIGRGGHNDRPGFGNGYNNNGRPGYGNGYGNGRPGYGNGNNNGRPDSNARPGGDRGNGQNVGQGNNRGNNFGNGSNNRGNDRGNGSNTTTRPSRGGNGSGNGNAGTYTNPGRGNNNAGAGRGTTTTRPSRGNFGGGSNASSSRPSRSQSTSTRSTTSRGSSNASGGRSFGRH